MVLREVEGAQNSTLSPFRYSHIDLSSLWVGRLTGAPSQRRIAKSRGDIEGARRRRGGLREELYKEDVCPGDYCHAEVEGDNADEGGL